jgi:vancomycin resistance protein VanJ
MSAVNNFSIRNLLRLAIHAAGLFYVTCMAFLLIVNHFLRQTSPFVALASTFSLYLFVAALPLALCLLLLRTRLALLILILLAVLFLSMYPILPRLSAILSDKNETPTITAMTFNLGLGLTAPELLAQSIAVSQADIVAVQELTTYSAAVLAADLAMAYPYQIVALDVGTTGFFSKLPIVSSQWHRPPGGRPFPHVILNQEGAELHVFPIHFFPPGIVWTEMLSLPRGMIEVNLEREIAYLLQQVAAVSGPVIVLGDFNMSEQSRAYAAMKASLQDGFRQAGFGLGRTFPNNFRLAGINVPFPLLRIDYVFHSPHLAATSAIVNCIEGQSDHCAVMVVLRWGRHEPKPRSQ